MLQLQALPLGLSKAPLMVHGGGGGAGAVRKRAALTALEAGILTIGNVWHSLTAMHMRMLRSPSRCVLRAVTEKRGSLSARQRCFSQGGNWCPATVLGALRAATPRLHLTHCTDKE